MATVETVPGRDVGVARPTARPGGRTLAAAVSVAIARVVPTAPIVGVVPIVLIARVAPIAQVVLIASVAATVRSAMTARGATTALNAATARSAMASRSAAIDRSAVNGRIGESAPSAMERRVGGRTARSRAGAAPITSRHAATREGDLRAAATVPRARVAARRSGPSVRVPARSPVVTTTRSSPTR